MGQAKGTLGAALLEEALTHLFCQVDDAYGNLNPKGQYCYAALKRLSDSEVITLALFQQLRGVESACDQDRGQDHCLYLRFFGQPDAGSSSRPDQALVGLNLATPI